MVNEGDYVAIFHSIHKVLKAEKLLKQAKVPFLLIPVPRQLTSDCGLALRFTPETSEKLLSHLQEANLPPVELHQRQGDDYREAGDELP